MSDDLKPDPFKGIGLTYCDVIGETEIVFAWLPVKCFDTSWVWLRPVARRLCVLKPHIYSPYHDPWWQYARLRKN